MILSVVFISIAIVKECVGVIYNSDRRNFLLFQTFTSPEEAS